jgi:hypothetical protein
MLHSINKKVILRTKAPKFIILLAWLWRVKKAHSLWELYLNHGIIGYGVTTRARTDGVQPRRTLWLLFRPSIVPWTSKYTFGRSILFVPECGSIKFNSKSQTNYHSLAYPSPFSKKRNAQKYFESISTELHHLLWTKIQSGTLVTCTPLPSKKRNAPG